MGNLRECLEGSKPFMELNKSGQAPVLNYNIPQKTSFTAYGTNILHLNKDVFNERAFQEPTNKLQQIVNIDIKDLTKAILNDIENGTNNSDFIIDLTKIDTNKFLKKSTTTNEKGEPIEQKAVIPLEITQKQKYSASNELKTTIEKELGYDIDYVAQELKNNKAAIVTENFGKFKRNLNFVNRPKTGACMPMLFVIEEYKTASYLGDYGAGKTLNTFSLLPGEKTTISVKSFYEKSETKSRSENILDSFSENSASEFENTLANESNFTSTTANSTTNTRQFDIATNISTSLSASVVLDKLINLSVSRSFDISGAASFQNETNVQSTQSDNINSLSEAIEKHSNSTNSNREVEVNTTSQTTETESTEKSTIRELENPNLNRVLNFVFRQLQQEYVSITYLNNIKIAFTNGHPEKTVVVSINELDKLLNAVIKPYYISMVREKILHDYMKVENYNNELVDFLEKITYNQITHETDKAQNNPPTAIYKDIIYYKKKAGLEDIYEASSGNSLNIKVPGVILNVNRTILRTPAVIVDALLGQGDALDCFNQLQQEAAAEKLQIENNKLQTEIKSIELEQRKLDLALEIIRKLPPEQQAEAYKTMLNNCCNAGQITITN
jgi:hypothetical protein